MVKAALISTMLQTSSVREHKSESEEKKMKRGRRRRREEEII